MHRFRRSLTLASGFRLLLTGIATLLLCTSLLGKSPTPQEMQVGQRLYVIEEEPTEIQFVDGGSTTLRQNTLVLFFEEAPNNYICHIEGKLALIPSSSAVPAAEAVELLRTRCDESPTPENYYGLAYAQILNGLTRSSLESTNAGLNLDNNDLELKLMKCRLKMMLKQPEEMNSLLEEIESAENKTKLQEVKIYDLKAMRAAREKQHDLAAELFSKAIEQMPHSTRLHSNLALCYFNMGDIETALTHINKAKKLDPASSVPWQFLAYFEPDNGVESMEKALELDPDSATALGYLHWYADSNGEEAEAQKLEIQLALARQTPATRRAPTAWKFATSPDESIRDPDTAERINELLYESIGDGDPLMQRVRLIRIAIALARGEESEAEAAFDDLDPDDFDDSPDEYQWLSEQFD